MWRFFGGGFFGSGEPSRPKKAPSAGAGARGACAAGGGAIL